MQSFYVIPKLLVTENYWMHQVHQMFAWVDCVFFVEGHEYISD